MKTTLLLVLAALPLVACGGAPNDQDASEGTVSESKSPLLMPITRVIDFDVDPNGAAIPDGTIVDSVYAAWGVTFTGILCSSSGCSNGHAYARRWGSTNIITQVPPSLGFPIFDARLGAVRADFAAPKSWASIDVTPVLPPEWLTNPVVRPWFEGYSSSGFLAPTVYYPYYGTTGWGTQQTLQKSAGSDIITWVRFSSQGTGGSGTPVYAAFDNLRFPDYVNIILQPPPCFPRRGC